MIDGQMSDRNELIEELRSENRQLRVEVGGLRVTLDSAQKNAIATEDHTLALYYRSILDKLCDRLNLHTASAFDDLVYTVDRISIDCTQFSEGIIERDRAISNLKLELEQCKRQSQINDELRSEAGVTLESYQNVLDGLRSLFDLPLKRNYLDLADHVQELQEWVKNYESNVNHYGETILNRDRTIAILEENLNRARSEHLEQLRAIVQMLEPLATHEDKGTLYLSHFGKAAMAYLIQKVISANIEKLDPNLQSYDNNF
jgi:cell division septum initiation protein DivIVA